ncbi:MAG: hypothetical protein A2381_00430 [Bdellovibrionales bacterium RIFOXYB1_FULL_37_110]|nr:MAG: hypothetical protein A2417_11485 [Bdellovibrionales bacterium RIFOXYC1_FULL_37_79]OFZ60860.1 MAG: hypothetical protein A2381_00430 [Bdellovibrionales bacterium RIFOXYB1_FULL_37_110]OFZ62390.1 MAG: hypothetical protein A2577_03095 [Bdellovibrionales bacterium RIFOXYD1_FULL_36_51]
MKKLLIGLSLIISQFSFGQSYYFECEDAYAATMKFEIHADRNVIEFSDISYFRDAQILKDLPFGMKKTSIMENGSKMDLIDFSYDWYYTADYTLKFSKQVHEYQVNEVTFLYLTFDDHDGASVENLIFKCTRIR